LGVVGGEGDFSGGLLRLAGITITFLVLLDSVLDAMLLTQVLRHRGKEGYGGGNCEKSGGGINFAGRWFPISVNSRKPSSTWLGRTHGFQGFPFVI
jgi:hypothetical protein